MKKLFYLTAFIFSIAFHAELFAQSFSIEQISAFPFPSELTSSAKGSKICWALDEQGKRNVYVAEGPEFTPRKLTDYNEDDGQEISSLTISSDGKWVVYVRGGDHGGNNASSTVNAGSDPHPPKVAIWSVPFSGGNAKMLVEGDYPAVSPNSDLVAYPRDGEVYTLPIDGSAEPTMLLSTKGNVSNLAWSPGGTQLLFLANRGGHSFVGVYTNSETPIQWIAPSFSRDHSPKWSPDGKNIVFVRTPGGGGKSKSFLKPYHRPWSIWTADVQTGEGTLLWKSPETLRGSVPTTHGGFNLHWGANDRIIFLSYHDGWPHLYSISSTGGDILLLTPGDYMVEHIRMSADGKTLVFSANTGPDREDLDRRHIGRVSVDQANMELITRGKGIEAYPVATGDGSAIAMLSATAIRPLLPAVMTLGDTSVNVLGEDLLPKEFPQHQLVSPKQVSFVAEDGTLVHGQLFEPQNAGKKSPAIVYVHGGPQRQMLLGWSYMDYYANAYAVNQYLAQRGFVVLSVNYRLGIGYGYEFHKPEKAGMAGASEYMDIKAAGEWLAKQPGVDQDQIGIYGGSYGGYLAALALGKDSDLFAAGVDIHGVHSRDGNIGPAQTFEDTPDREEARKIAFESSPIAHVDTWTSPVLLIHADDDRNVPFSQSIELAMRFEDKKFPYEQLVVPDDTHHWMKYSNRVKVNKATVNFLDEQLMDPINNTKEVANLGLKGKVIAIDPGHGGTAEIDSYRVGPTGEREEWVNLRVALILKELLEEKGAKVVMTRTEDVQVPLAERSLIAKEANADLFISIHHNATADKKVNFPIIYFHGSAQENKAGVAFGKALADAFKRHMFDEDSPVSLVSDYAIFPKGGASVLRGTYGIPAVLAEASFFTNPKEEKRLKKKGYNRKEAEAYLEAIQRFFGEQQVPILEKSEPEFIPVFEVLQEADRMQPEALLWHQDFEKGKALMEKGDRSSLEMAYELFTRSARSFPDSYVAADCHQYRINLLEKLDRIEEAAQERKRVEAFFVKK